MNVHGRINKTLFFALLFIGSIYSQNFDPIFIPFEVDGEDLQNPLIGGLTAPQFASFDLDGEGPEDLIVFERNGGVLLPFINRSTPGNPDYLYAPEYTPNFPRLVKFVKFIDFNNDGKKDIFALSRESPGIAVWRNTSVGGVISFEFMKFNFGAGNFLQIPSGGGFTNVFVSSIDIPAIIDTDNDGDLDILSFEPDGGFVFHYQNMVKEKGLPEDTLVYELVDRCWGNFVENGFDEAIILSQNRSNCALPIKGPNVSSQRHAGSTVTVFDADGDNDLDMLLGDISNRSLVFLENDEVNGDPFIIDQDLNFPSNSEKVDMFVFISSFFIDVDNDGKRDLIVCPNNELQSDNINHIWYYRNIGEDDAPIFDLVQRDFLHETTLRMGHSSHPCFLDYNQDGLLDLLVGMNLIYSDASPSSISLYLYENVGTANQPSYRLVDDDYLGLADAVDENNGFLAPAAGDLDGDGDIDLLVAERRSLLLYFENKAGAGQPFEFENFIFEYKDLNVGSNGKPFIIDLDGDGLSDIVMGESGTNGNPLTGAQGGVNFYKNVGTIGDPDFIAREDTLPNTNILGEIFTKTVSDTGGESAPYFFESEGELMVAVGSRRGNIYLYDDIEGNLFGTFNEVTDSLPILHNGRRTAPIVADIDNDGFHEMIIGNDNGGLMAFNTNFISKGPSNTNNTSVSRLNLMPNPTHNFLRANVDANPGSKFTITGLDGKFVMNGTIKNLNSGIDVSTLPSGLYVLSAEIEEGVLVEKFVKY
ncbi:MAG: T9SS type A sorting domain-containing protein [Bacteroidota bacterium]